MSDFWISFSTDLVAGTAYLVLSLTVFSIVKRTEFRFSNLLICFAIFTVLRGLGHYAEAIMLWYPAPGLWLIIKTFVAAIAVAVALWIFRMQKEIVALARVDHRTAELENAQLLLRESKSRAEDANSAKSQFLANMSHEIRTPLAAISGFTELLLEKDMSAIERDKALETIRRNSDHLAALINEVLDLSKIEAGHLEIEKLTFEPAEVLDYVTSVVNFKAVEKGVMLKVTVDPSIPQFISTDPTRLRQILVNVIGNAVKFTERGSVSVHVAPGELADPRDRSKIHFLIRDTGIGIPEKCQKKLFQPFSQSDNSTSRRFGGTGLGLALSRKLARAMGGDVTLVGSAENVGSEFKITIDAGIGLTSQIGLSNAGAERAKRILDSTASSFYGVRILAVDDSPDNRDLIQAILRPSGALVEVAENGADAVGRAIAEDFDIILMDVQMPKLDGHQATRILRSRGYRKPIIALTAHALKEDRIQAFEAGFDDHLTKPIQRVSLFDVIGHYVKNIDKTERSQFMSPS